MALANVMVEGSYTVVDNIKYSAQNRLCHFDVLIYRDSSKQELLGRMRRGSESNEIHVSFKGFITEENYPEDAELGDTFIVKRDHMRKDQHSVVIRTDNNSKWILRAPLRQHVATNTATGERYSYDVDKAEWEPFPADSLFEFERWDQYFSLDAQAKKGNIVACAYEYLKTFPEFEKAEDC